MAGHLALGNVASLLGVVAHFPTNQREIDDQMNTIIYVLSLSNYTRMSQRRETAASFYARELSRRQQPAATECANESNATRPPSPSTPSNDGINNRRARM